ncbi:hypothetical protein K490DRAFT_46706 [Saccharata proteae CBS 121410]|uniref:Anaphase-promoting complex subunit 1 n=1 Tax=Saccharata proteae CBS 121410 TaxID=1314787 RepID=A0A9P4LTA1_9PEZI|nr:hypothetical protein K490DRAFT_46706 [Saccharata proteae CBS 121410]
MASIRSLGLHSPAGLSYLVAEGLLPEKPSPEQYTWETYNDDGGEDEVLATQKCVVWSRGGIVRKAFNFEIEQENVLQAVLTWFPTDKSSAARKKNRGFVPDHGKGSAFVAEGAGFPVKDRQTGREDTVESPQQKARALVVFLKTQAHVFFLAGSSHVVNLPFEVEKAFPAPRGLLIQRKLPTPNFNPSSPLLPRVPQNSFLSSQAQSQLSAPSQSHSPSYLRKAPGSFPTSRKSKSGISPAYPASLFDLLRPPPNNTTDSLPRLFSFTDPFSEMGLVVSSQSSHDRLHLPGSNAAKTVETVDKAEEVLYVTPRSEIPESTSHPDEHLILVVTANYEKRAYSIWYASYIDPKPASAKSKNGDRAVSVSRSKRRSSYNPATGATTPALRSRDGFRDSFGGAGRSKTAGPSFRTSQTREPSGEQTAEEVFASQLDPETDLSRQPSRESRRVSSLLSRTDLSTSFDKSAFQDMATHRPSFNASLGPHTRRGHSLGSHAKRSSSGMMNRRTRESTPASLDLTNLSAVTLDDTLDDDLGEEDDTLDDLLGAGSRGGTDFSLQEPIQGLCRELLLIKSSEIPFGNSESIFNTSLSPAPKDSPKIFTLANPASFTCDDGDHGRLYLYMMQKSSAELVEHEITVLRRRLATPPGTGRPHRSPRDPPHILLPKLIESRYHHGFVDAAKISEGSIERLLCLTKGSSSGYMITVYAGWCPQARFSVEPCDFKVSNPYGSNDNLSASESAARRRTLEPPKNFIGVSHCNTDGAFNLIEPNGQQHRQRLKLWPQKEIVSKTLQVCRFSLPQPQGDHILAIWWAIANRLQDEKRYDVEWAALVTAIFAYAVGDSRQSISRLTDATHYTIGTPSRLRSGGSSLTESAFELMWRTEAQTPLAKSWDSPAWSWVEQTLAKPSTPSRSVTRSRRAGLPTVSPGIRRKSDLIPFCAKIAREFMHEPLGKLFKAEWNQPTITKKSALRTIFVPTIAAALHLFREETRLDVLSNDFSTLETGDLAPVLAQIGRWFDWELWSWKGASFYGLDGASTNKWVFEDASLSTLEKPLPPWEKPPSIYEWIEQCPASQVYLRFPSLTDLQSSNEMHQATRNSQRLKQQLAGLTPRTIALGLYCEKMCNKSQRSSRKVETMLECGIDNRMLETMPAAIVASLREAVIECQASPPTTWGLELLRTVHREDLHMLLKQDQVHSTGPNFPSVSRWSRNKDYADLSLQASNAIATRDVHSITQSADTHESATGSSEADRHMITRLIFSEDRRYIEALRLLEPLRPAVAECIPDPSWSEAEHLDAQKSVMQWVMLRTFALPTGYSMLQFDSKRPLVTERYPLHGFTTDCTMKPLNNTVSADRTTYTEEKFCWAFFHAGVSAGLSIAKRAEGIDTSWIAYNKPADLSNKHAGLLFGLGLNGHLKSIAKWLSFKYLTPKHSMTSIGLLLGLSVSYMGTMDTLVTRLLSVHVTRMLPPGAADLNLPPLAQTTGLMGIGLLYLNSQHRRMTEIMISEIEHVEMEDPSGAPNNIRDEGYRLAAGFSLGLINLGKGNDLRGLHDMRLVERLLSVAVGTKPVDLVHILDQATAGATIAIALVFMKTGNKAVASRIDVPDTLPQFDYVRPDIFLLRTLAKHLILWDQIQANSRWIIRNLPAEYTADHHLRSIKVLRSEQMPFFNIMAGLLWSIGLKYSGTANIQVRDFLISYLDQFIRLCHLPAHRYDARLARNTARNCQDLVALSVATVMAGTGDIDVFRRLRLLHGRVSPEATYGSHLAAHMALGALFLAGGSYTFNTSNLAIAALVCAFYPLFPQDVLDNKAHLQAFRHFWALAAEPRCVIIRDVETHRAIPLPIVVLFKDGTMTNYDAPCLLPELDTIASVQTNSPEHWQVTLDFINNPIHLSSFRRTQTIHVRRRPAHEAYSSTFSATLMALNDTQSSQTTRAMWDWIFDLPVFADLSKADIGLILPAEAAGAIHTDMNGTVVDDRLMVRSAAKSWDRDRLAQLKLLFVWAERVQSEGGKLRWLGKEVVEGLKSAVMERGRAIAGGEVR